ncbi:MAG: glycosyltransferase N-terminal domain-containing protein [Syntrophobacterales bacterium]|jgi:3-deoxy-D-manno-octulosonic-acid transferase
MNWARLLYNVTTLPMVAALAPFAYLACRFLPDEKAERWKQRLGFHSQKAVHSRHKRPLVWIHAVSVGEVGVASTLIKALDKVGPGLGIVVSSTTPHGHQLAQQKLANRATCIYFPLDFIVSVRLALRHVRPDIIVCLETELWPNFLGEARRLGISTLLVNGRISEGSFRRYRKILPLMRHLLEDFSVLAMASSNDAKRVIGIGAPAARVKVTGNMKGAGLVEQADPNRAEDLKRKLQLKSGQSVLVAGSIRDRELSWLPEIYSRLLREQADLVGIFAPRHLNRLGRLEACLKRQGLEFQRLSSLVNGSEQRTTATILVDGVGKLFDLYGLGDLIFCGGSLVPLGGQNILEPAAWGKPVFYGPYMDNFLEASELLETAGCGIMVQDRDELLVKLRHFLANPEALKAMGSNGRAAMSDRNQIAVRQAELIRDTLDSLEIIRS